MDGWMDVEVAFRNVEKVALSIESKALYTKT